MGVSSIACTWQTQPSIQSIRSPVVVEPQAWRGLQFRCFPTQASLGWSRNHQYHAVAGDRVVTGTPVDDQDYQVPFRFTGKLNKLTLTIDWPKLSPEHEKRLMEAQRDNKASE